MVKGNYNISLLKKIVDQLLKGEKLPRPCIIKKLERVQRMSYRT